MHDDSSTLRASPLYPRLADDWRHLLATPSIIIDIVDALGSPTNLLLPKQLSDNLRRYQSIYQRFGLQGSVFFAHKANRSTAIIRELARIGVGIDVASVGELQHALAAGIPGSAIMATGPKNAEFLWLASTVKAVVNVDSIDEIERLGTMIEENGLPQTAVMIRLSTFSQVGVAVLSRPSRFGVAFGDLGKALDCLDRHRNRLRVEGLAFHLDTNGLTEKAAAMEACLVATSECRARGHNPRAIDIGGGFGVRYVESIEEWQHYTDAISAGVLGTQESLTWGGFGYGLRAERGAVRGTLGLYPAARDASGPDYLSALLQMDSSRFGRPLGSLLLESMIDLHIEPGRALLDQVGATAVRVNGVRHGPGGAVVVDLEANRNDMSAEEHGVLVDPILVPRSPRPQGEPVNAFLLGNLCLENDLITRRLVHLPSRPERGDLLVFPNTAGYFMDFAASSALMQPTATKVAVTRSGDAWRWCVDTKYWPLERN